MRLINYEHANKADKIQWLDSIVLRVGLPYFGGKSIIGKYLLNNIFNLAVQMKRKNKPADIFIDAFTGGGKIGLSIPEGWFNKIVINDLNYGVYCYYKCCKKHHEELIYMIEEIGDIMCEDFFYVAAYLTSFGPYDVKWTENNKNYYVLEGDKVDEITAAALTYWITNSSYNAQTAASKVNYNLSTFKIDSNGNKIIDKELERKNIEKVIKLAYKRIPKIHRQLNRYNYVIERLDYRELIKKYNGKIYHDVLWKGEDEYRAILQQEGRYNEEEFKDVYDKYSKEHTHQNEEYANKNKLWYFDPPYHPLTLYAGESARYANTFDRELANEMIDILSGNKEDKYGAINYFIKSDYDIKEAVEKAEEAKNTNYEGVSQEKKKWYEDLNNNKDKYSKIFEPLEKDPFCKICVGSFDKNAIEGTGDDVKISVGNEYIWCRGFETGYEKVNSEDIIEAKQ